MPKQLQHLNILGTQVACIDYAGAVEACKRLARSGAPAAVSACNTHIVAQARHDSSFGDVMRQFHLILPDGTPLLWSLNARGARLQDRVYGPYFMRHALKETPRPFKHFFFGGSEPTLKNLVEAVRFLQPDIDIVGAYSPPFRKWSQADELENIRRIRDADPDFIWVALGGERQERWIVSNLQHFERGVFFAVGDAFALLAGERPFAPLWMQKRGLTWLYRLWQEPGRLWRRYLKYNSLFIWYSILEVWASLSKAWTSTHASTRACPTSSNFKKSCTIGPVSFMDLHQNDLISLILEHSNTPRLFTALNAFSLSLALENAKLCRVLNESFTCFCDGYGIHVCHRIFENGSVRNRATPTDWIVDLLAGCARQNRKVFLLGDRPQVVKAFHEKMEKCFPGVICGFHHGFFNPGSQEEAAVIEAINQSGTDILLVGMGMPRQEFWTEDHKTHLHVSAILMIGASMSFLTGFRKRGPKWATDHGLEWLFRLLYEPMTMGPRYFVRLPKLLGQLAEFYRKT